MIKKFTALMAIAAAFVAPAAAELVVTSNGTPVKDGDTIELGYEFSEEVYEFDGEEFVIKDYKWDPALLASMTDGSASTTITMDADVAGWQICWPSQCQMVTPGKSTVCTGTLNANPSDLQVHMGKQDYDGTFVPSASNVTIKIEAGSESMTFYIKGLDKAVAGVSSIAAGNGEAVYYNLQGVRVANPERGLYIKVQGNKVSKVAL